MLEILAVACRGAVSWADTTLIWKRSTGVESKVVEIGMTFNCYASSSQFHVGIKVHNSVPFVRTCCKPQSHERRRTDTVPSRL